MFTPLVKKSISSVINDIISDRLNTAIKNGEKASDELQEPNASISEDTEEKMPEGVVCTDKESGVVTTQEELDAYNIIRSILRKEFSAETIVYRDFKSYFAIGINNASCWWGCRLAFGTRKKNLYIPTEGYKEIERIEIETIDDIFKHADKLIQSFGMANNAYENYKSKH